ncbi:MAG: peptidoglycan DD-metalloendopeptidase family protein [Deltaproteobacteria bacterium]|nr:peptidoglycan DD-metalloendopeptidase family protein [Deltaproteobacteria bacterium]
MIDSKDRYTLVLFRTGSGVHRKFSLPVKPVKRALWLLAPGLCALLVGALVAIALYLVNLHNINDYSRLAKKNRELEKQISFFAQRMTDLADQFTNLKESNARVKVLANLAIVPGRIETGGIGGPDPLAAELTVSSIDSERKQQLARMHRDLQQLELGVAREESELGHLSTYLKERQTLLNFTPSVWPVRGWISSAFGYRVSPFTGRRELHRGIDIVNRAGTPVVVSADGQVVFAGYKTGYGKMVIVDHGLGKVTKYGHLSKIDVQNGDLLVRGQELGLLGNTGRSTGPHLHYEVVENGKVVDPVDYLID